MTRIPIADPDGLGATVTQVRPVQREAPWR